MVVYQKTTKDQILSLLKTSRRLSITELANELQITEMAVRRHIRTLEHDSLVESVINRQTKGRPSKLYQLSNKGEELFPKKYKQLSIDLLKDLEEMGQESLITELLTKRKNRLIQQYGIQTTGKSFLEKLEALKDIQTAEGFMPEISKENGVIDFKEFNCPFIETATEFKQICRSEIEFIKDFLETDSVESKSCLADGDHCCHYIIKQK